MLLEPIPPLSSDYPEVIGLVYHSATVLVITLLILNHVFSKRRLVLKASRTRGTLLYNVELALRSITIEKTRVFPTFHGQACISATEIDVLRRYIDLRTEERS